MNIDENWLILTEKLNDLINFNEIFREDVTYNNIKSHKEPGFHPLFRRKAFQKITRRGQIDPPHPPPLAVLELMHFY